MTTTPPHLFTGQYYRHLRIGLLGGSFNPAHEGHLAISLEALKKMDLDFVWWLVSPQNPLKSEKDMASLAARMGSAQKLAEHHPRIIVTNIETQLATRFTADTLKKLRARFPRTRFIWMMGADNLLQIPRWQRWQEIFTKHDIAIFRRPPYKVGCLHGMAATRFQKQRINKHKAKLLGRTPSRHWILFENKLNIQSASAIRAQLKE